ncbi:MAG: carboxypeptidase regulatory-like domain-containing protein [Nitrospirales bacterium]
MSLVCSVVSFFLIVPNVSSALQGSGMLTGHVSFHGVVRPGETLEVKENQDVCGESVVRHKVSVDSINHGLQFAIVSLASMGTPLARSAMPQTLVMNEQCNFSPRISAAQSLDNIEIHNQDPILHNTHITINQRTFLNVAQLPGSRPIVKTIKQSGLHQILCDKHKFMSGVLMVFDHPYFRVTNDKGEFSMKGIPPGQYVVRVWHETLGILSQQVTILSEKTVMLQFDYK